MNAKLLRQFFHRSREWARANRGLELMHMAAAALHDFAQVDSGFFVYQKRFVTQQGARPSVFAPWGVFSEDVEELQNLVDESLPDARLGKFNLERWNLAEDLPTDRIRKAWAKYPLLEYGIWPLTSREQMIGAIVVARTIPVITGLTVEMSEAIVDASAAQLSVAFDLILSTRLAEQASQRDLLTGVYNRRGLETALPSFVARAKETGQFLTVVVIDMDDLKGINDSLGHPAGDFALREIANILSRHLRKDDLVCRYGGDEFMIAHLTDRCEVEDLVRRLEDAVARESVGLSISAGGAVFGVDGDSLEACYRLADSRLYERKRAKGGIRLPD